MYRKNYEEYWKFFYVFYYDSIQIQRKCQNFIIWLPSPYTLN